MSLRYRVVTFTLVPGGTTNRYLQTRLRHRLVLPTGTLGVLGNGLSGTMIRTTLIRGLNHLQNAKHVSSDRAHEGLQSPSDPKERKGLKKAQYAAHLHSTAHSKPPSNPRSDLRFARGLPAETLDNAPQLRLARGYPSADGVSDPPAHRPPDKSNKCQPLHRGVGGQTASGHHAAQRL